MQHLTKGHIFSCSFNFNKRTIHFAPCSLQKVKDPVNNATFWRNAKLLCSMLKPVCELLTLIQTDSCNLAGAHLPCFWVVTLNFVLCL